jgi:hypothetical protein
MQRELVPDAGRLDGLVEQARDLPWRQVQALPAAREQPALLQRHTEIVLLGAHLPPRAQQIERLGRQHYLAILLALQCGSNA